MVLHWLAYFEGDDATVGSSHAGIESKRASKRGSSREKSELVASASDPNG